MGRGTALAHHGEILQGAFRSGNGHLQLGLVTLECPLFYTEARFTVADEAGVTVEPASKAKARRAAELTLQHLGQRQLGGRLRIHSTVPCGRGMGSSTSDVMATIQSVAAAFERPIEAKTIAQLAVRAELASDPLMFPGRSMLFAHTEGVVIEDFGRPMLPLEIVGFDSDADGDGLDTLSLVRPTYLAWEVEALEVLLAACRRALRTEDPRLLGKVASASARLHQRYLAKRNAEWVNGLSKEVGAVGWQIAHSGTVIGLLFDPAERDLDYRIARARSLLSRAGIDSWRFSSGS